MSHQVWCRWFSVNNILNIFAFLVLDSNILKKDSFYVPCKFITAYGFWNVRVSKWWQISFLYELPLIGMKMVTKNMLNFHLFFLTSGWFVTWTCFYEIHDPINGFWSVTTVCISYKMREKKKSKPTQCISTHYNHPCTKTMSQGLQGSQKERESADYMASKDCGGFRMYNKLCPSPRL